MVNQVREVGCAPVLHKHCEVSNETQTAIDDNSTLEKAHVKDNSSPVLKRFASVAGLLAALFLYETSGSQKLPGKSLFNLFPLKSIDKSYPYVLGQPPATRDYSDDEYLIFANRLRDLKGFAQREEYLKSLLERINPELLPGSSDSKEDTALTIFNKKNDLSLVCMGIKQSPLEFVFINSFAAKNTDPVRIALTPDEMQNIKTRDSVVELLDRNLTEQKEQLEKQYSIWAKPYQFDFPKNNGACMIALALGNLSGMETDMARALEIYNKYYGMSVEAICLEDRHKENMDKALKEKGFENLPQATSATKDSILRELERTLKKAIDEKKSAFMFHYGAHGSEDGRVWASDQSFLPKELAEVISKSYNGSPLCAQIDITIWAGSCYSGKQLDGMKEYFENHSDIAVKNLRVITESNYTVAGASTTPDNASLVSDLMTDNSGPLDYYCSWYREYLQYLNSKGIELKNPIGTYLHEVRFADLMGRYDSSYNQDAQGFHYYNDPIKHKKAGQYFTDTKNRET